MNLEILSGGGLKQFWKSRCMGRGGGQKTVPSVVGVWIFWNNPLGLKGLIIQCFMLLTCIGQNWISASLTGLPVSNFSYFASFEIYQLTLLSNFCPNSNSRCACGTQCSNKRFQQVSRAEKNRWQNVFFYIYMVWQSTSDQSWKNQKFPFLLTQLMTPLLMI